MVITAPLWGKVSKPPDDNAAILCNISGEIEKFWLISIKVGARADKLIPNPPEAEAVSPQIILTDIKVEGKKRCLAKDYLNGIDKKELIGCVLKWKNF